MKEKNPFRKKAKEMRLTHIESRDTKYLTNEERSKLRIQLRRQTNRERKITIITYAAILVVLLVLILLISKLNIV